MLQKSQICCSSPICGCCTTAPSDGGTKKQDPWQSRGSSYSRAVEWFLIMLRLLMGCLYEESLVKYISLGAGCHLMWTRLPRVDDVEIRVRSVRFAAKTKHRNIGIVGRSIRISQKLEIGTTTFKSGAASASARTKTIHLLLVAAPCHSSTSRGCRKSFLWRCTHGKPSPKP